MKTKKVVVLPYDPNWKMEFLKIKEELEKALSTLIISVEHIGSTSVEGLSAKPIIDIDMVIDIKNFEMCRQKLEQIGYIYEGDLGVKGREAFNYFHKEHLMKHHLYVCDQNSKELIRHLSFKNWLSEHPEDREKYGAIKIEMAKRYPNDIDSYILGKQEVVEEIYKKIGLI